MAKRVEELEVGVRGGEGERGEPPGRAAFGRGEPERRGIERHRPAVVLAQGALEADHRRAGHAERDPAVEVEGGAVGEQCRVGEVRRGRVLGRGRRAVAPPGGAMAARTRLRVQLPPPRERRRPLRHRLERGADPGGERLAKRVRRLRHRRRRSGALHQGEHAGERRVRGGGERRGKRRGGLPRLTDEEPGLLDLRHRDDPPADDADAVLLGGQAGGGEHPARRGHAVLRARHAGEDDGESGGGSEHPPNGENHFHPV